MSTSNIIPLPPTLTPTNGKKPTHRLGYVLTDDIVLKVAQKYGIRVKSFLNHDGTTNVSHTRTEVITIMPAKMNSVRFTHIKDSTGSRTIPFLYIANNLEPGKATPERAQKFKDAMGAPDVPQWFLI